MNENSSSIPNAHLGLEQKQSLEMGIPRARANPASPQGSGLPLTPLGLLRLPPPNTHTPTSWVCLLLHFPLFHSRA